MVAKWQGFSARRGILIAKDIGPEVAITVRRTEGVELFKYTLQVAVERVDSL